MQLLITGIIGLIVIRYQRIKRAKTREHCFMFLRMDSYILSLLSVLLCCVALIFAAIHYCRLTASDTKCKSMHLLVEHGSCICTFNAPSIANTTEPMLSQTNEEVETDTTIDNSYNVEYRWVVFYSGIYYIWKKINMIFILVTWAVKKLLGPGPQYWDYRLYLIVLGLL